MTTVGGAVDETLNAWLLGTFSSQFNAIGTGIIATDLEISCQFPLTGISVGAMVAIEDELCYVIDTDQTNNRMTVDRGYRGTKAAAHVTGTDIEVNPRFPRFMVRMMMAQDIASWPYSLYSPQQFTASIGTLDNTIAIPSSINGFVPRDILRIRRQSLLMLDTRYRRTEGYEADFDLMQIMLNEEPGFDRTYTIRAACAFNGDALDDDDNDLAEDVGLTPGMVEILELGAAYRLIMGRGSVRLFPEAQGQSRSVQEVGGQDLPRLAGTLLSLKKDRMGEEAEKLSRALGFGGT